MIQTNAKKFFGLKQVKIGAVATLLMTSLSLQPVKAIEAENAVVVTPGAGMSFKVGTKKAVTYFNTANGECDVTILLSEQNPIVDNQYQAA